MVPPLDHHLIHEAPVRIYMGELPRTFSEVPAEVVVNLCGVFPHGQATGRVVLCLSMHDALDPRMVPDRRSFEEFLASVHHYSHTRATYWHCHAGINRSGMALAAYLHLYRGLRISESIGLLRDRRHRMVLCNHLFERLLREWYGESDEQHFEPARLESYALGFRSASD